MNHNVKHNNFEYLAIIILCGIIGYFIAIEEIAIALSDDYGKIRFLGIITFLLIIIQFVYYWTEQGKKHLAFSFFLISFILFHFGVVWIYSLGGDYNFFYLMQCQPKYVYKTILFNFLCVTALFLSASNIAFIKPFKFSRINKISINNIYYFAKKHGSLLES